jgi:predicted lipoprotein with Yx(FWY)xxD motif
MKRSIVAVVGAVLVLVACSSDSNSSSSSSSTSSSSSSAASSSPASSGSSAEAAAYAKTASIQGLKLAQNSKVGKTILVTDTGATLYMFEPDGTSNTSTVPAAIQNNWPAVLSPGNLTATGFDPSGKIAVGPLPGGQTHLIYNGHLLYLFSNDSAAGDANGQGLGGNWFVLDQNGDKVPA